MKNKFNSLAIGMFVLGAAAIAVIAIMGFGAAKFFTTSEMCVSYFSESVHGLDVGAPVKYKGVTIGKVENISIMADKNSKVESSVAVTYSIDLDLLKKKTGGQFRDFDKLLFQQISEGLRAKLNYQSIVTGMIYIELDYFAEENEKYELRYAGFDYIEIPSSKSGLAELGKMVEKTITQISSIDFKSIGEHLDSALVNIDNKLKEIDTQGISDATKNTLKNINKALEDARIRESFKNLNAALSSTQKEFAELTNAAKHTMALADELLINVNTVISPKSPFRYEFSLLMKNLNSASVSISNFTDYLQRNPSALVTGKLQPEK